MFLDLDAIVSTYLWITVTPHPPFVDPGAVPSSICSLLCEDAPMNTASKRRHHRRGMNRPLLCRASDYIGQIAYELGEFNKDYGDPAGQLFTFEVTYNATTYVYANVAGEVRSGQVVFDLSVDDLVATRKTH